MFVEESITTKNKKIAQLSATIYTVFMVLAALLGVLKYAVFAKLLEPESFGLYNLVLTIYVFVIYAGSLGLNEALIKMGGVAHGKGELELIHRLRDVSIFYGGVITSFCGLIYVLGVWVFVKDVAIAQTLSLAAILAVAALEFNLVDTYLRIKQQFVFFSAMLFFKTLVVLTVGWHIAPIYSVNGVILVEIMASFGLFLIFLYVGGRGFKFEHIIDSTALFRNAIRNGFPMLASMFVRYISISMDRWVIAASIGLVALAKYAFAMIIYLVAVMASGFLTHVLGPRWLSAFGRSGDLAALFKSIKKVVLMLVVMAIVFMGPFFWTLPLLLNKYYPKYAGNELFWTAVFIYIGIVILVSTHLFDWLFIASSNEKILLKMSIGTLCATILLIFGAYFFGANIISYAIVFLSVRVFSAVMYGRSLTSILK